MKLDAETLRKLALLGAKLRLQELEVEVKNVRELVRQLGATQVPDGRRTKPKKAKRTRRRYSEKFKADVVKEAREADNASAVGKKHDVSPSLVRLWMGKKK